jgi:hypothetical protein
MIGCLLSSRLRVVEALGAAYGIAVTGTMTITTVLFYVIARQRWHWSVLWAGAGEAFLTIDLAFFGANVIKLPDGAGCVRDRQQCLPPHELLASGDRAPTRIPGAGRGSDGPLPRVERAATARARNSDFLTPDVDGAPLVLSVTSGTTRPSTR